MNKLDRIKRSREFAKRSITGNIGKINKQDYHMFLISKFLLLKEYIIKKDSRGKILYFDYNKNKKYLPSIKYIVDFIINNGGSYQINSTIVIIRPQEKSSEELQKYIWIFNKIRDSFSHGSYEIDVINNRIIIDNDHQDETDPYFLKCSFPIELLESFTYRTQKKNTSEKGFSDSVKSEREIFGYTFDKMVYDINKYKNYYNDINVDNKEILNLKNFNNSIYLNSKRQEKIINLLLSEINKMDSLSSSKRKVLLDYLKTLDFIDFKALQVISPKKPDQKYVDKLANVISEIAIILGIRFEPNNLITLSAIYNYMQLLFSLNDYNLKNKDVRSNLGLGYLKMSKLNPVYIARTKIGDEININSQYFVKVTAINKETKNFIRKMQELFKSYNKDMRTHNAIRNLFNQYYNKIIDAFENTNAFILTSIRNSIEHANITDEFGYINLEDRNNQEDSNTTNFKCCGSSMDFYELTYCLEIGDAKDKFTFEDFFSELEYVLEKDVYKDLLDIIRQIKEINEKSLVNVLTEIKNKKM